MGEGKVYNFFNGSQNVEHIETQINNYNYFGNDSKDKDLGDFMAEHPIASYVMDPSKIKEIVDWLHQNVKAGNKPKEQLAPIKAALDCKPKALNPNLTFEVVKQEFGLTMSQESYKNWINGNRGYDYDNSELEDYIDALSSIMES